MYFETTHKPLVLNIEVKLPIGNCYSKKLANSDCKNGEQFGDRDPKFFFSGWA